MSQEPAYVAEIFRDSASVNEALRLLAKIAKSVTV
jgi:hypothetical protein